MLLPRDRVIGPEHELARADLRYEMPQAFGGKHHGIVVQLLEIFRRRLGQLDLRVAVLR